MGSRLTVGGGGGGGGSNLRSCDETGLYHVAQQQFTHTAASQHGTADSRVSEPLHLCTDAYGGMLSLCTLIPWLMVAVVALRPAAE